MPRVSGSVLHLKRRKDIKGYAAAHSGPGKPQGRPGAFSRETIFTQVHPKVMKEGSDMKHTEGQPPTKKTIIVHKAPGADVKSGYRLKVEIGLVIALLLMVLAFRMQFQSGDTFEIVEVEQEVVQMEEIKQTKQDVKPPPPPRPPVPVEVPNDEVLEDVALDLDATLDLDAPISDVPPPPPAPKETAKVVDEEPEVFVVVEQMPELVGGIGAIQSCVNYPEIARKAGLEGRVVVQFVVDEKGKVLSPSVARSVGGGLDEEAVRCVTQANFKPGMQRGKPVRVQFAIPVTFKLNSR